MGANKYSERRPRRKSKRAKFHNYSWSSSYLITIVAKDRVPLFDIPELRTTLGATWKVLPERFPNVILVCTPFSTAGSPGSRSTPQMCPILPLDSSPSLYTYPRLRAFTHQRAGPARAGPRPPNPSTHAHHSAPLAPPSMKKPLTEGTEELLQNESIAGGKHPRDVCNGHPHIPEYSQNHHHCIDRFLSFY